MTASTLCTCFEPFGPWEQNASQLVVQQLRRQRRAHSKFRSYPVDYGAARALLMKDLGGDYANIVHLGQAANCADIQLEAVAANLAGDIDETHRQFRQIITEGPPAYTTTMPIDRWQTELQQSGIPARISHHAGTYLCNAVYYLSAHFASLHSPSTRIVFIHLPVDLATRTSARAVRHVLKDLAQ